MEYKRLYIAYGSNINLEQMAQRCPNSKVISKEMMKGYFAVKESVFEVDGLKKTYQQTLVTGKGQMFIIGLLKKYYGKEMVH